jgi:hypothetical protein
MFSFRDGVGNVTRSRNHLRTIAALATAASFTVALSHFDYVRGVTGEAQFAAFRVCDSNKVHEK